MRVCVANLRLRRFGELNFFGPVQLDISNIESKDFKCVYGNLLPNFAEFHKWLSH